LLAFLSKLEVGLHRETTKAGSAKDATQVAQRSKAIRQIEDFVTDKQKQSVFAHVNKNVFAFQLALRARSPRNIDQKNTTLCGPVALIYDVAKPDPERYVDFAISLFSTGRGQFGAAQVTPSARIRRGYRVGRLPEADYVVLASVRETDAIAISSDFLRNIFTLTKPGALCEFLTRAGYSDVQDHTFLNLSGPLKFLNAVTPFGLNASGHNPIDSGAGNLQKAAEDLQKGRFVVMNADSAVAKAVKDRGGLVELARPLPAGDTHWTAIRKLQINKDDVLIKLITSGGSFEHTLNKDALLSRYAGYISADP
jgi:hypothetical protein